MKYPIKDWENLKNGYTFGVKTFYSNFHLGIDKICPVGTSVYAPVGGDLTKMIGTQGGLMGYLKGNDGKLYRFMHLSYLYGANLVIEGELIGLTGNSGTATTAPHLHLDLSKDYTLKLNDTSHFIDPELYLKENIMNNYEGRIVQNAEAGTPEAGQFSFVQDGKRRVITDARAGVACLSVIDKNGEKVFSLTSKAYHAIPQGNNF